MLTASVSRRGNRRTFCPRQSDVADQRVADPRVTRGQATIRSSCSASRVHDVHTCRVRAVRGRARPDQGRARASGDGSGSARQLHEDAGQQIDNEPEWRLGSARRRSRLCDGVRAGVRGCGRVGWRRALTRRGSAERWRRSAISATTSSFHRGRGSRRPRRSSHDVERREDPRCPADASAPSSRESWADLVVAAGNLTMDPSVIRSPRLFFKDGVGLRFCQVIASVQGRVGVN